MKLDENFEDMWTSFGHSVATCVLLTSLLSFTRLIGLLSIVVASFTIYQYKSQKISTNQTRRANSTNKNTKTFNFHLPVSGNASSSHRIIRRSSSCPYTSSVVHNHSKVKVKKTVSWKGKVKQSSLLGREFSTYIDGGNE